MKPSETWTKPTSFPEIPPGATIGVDTETYCEDLGGKGPQFITGEDHVCGICLAYDDYSAYFPIAHKEGNCDIPVVEWFRELLNREDISATFANHKFDGEGLHKLGIVPKCKLYDIQVTDALLDENLGSYSLNSISIRRGLGPKQPGEMEEELVRRGYIKRGKPDYSKLPKLDPKLVGPYGASDARLTLAIHNQQMPKVVDEELVRVLDLECDLIPVLMDMRIRGVPVDVDKADILNTDMGVQLEDELEELRSMVDFPIDPFSPQSLAQLVKFYGLTPPRTTKDNDSISNEYLAATGIDPLQRMARYRQGERFRRDVVQGVILDQSHKGRLHSSWYSTRGASFMGADDHGTRSGRLSSGDPSLQVIPKRHPIHGPLVRELFIPEQGERFCRLDMQAQEIRVGLHFACKLKLSGAEEIRQEYLKNPKLDFHEKVKDIVNTVLEEPITRDTAKTTNLSLVYGMGKPKLAGRLGFSISQTETFLKGYHSTVPFVKEALNAAMAVANSRGYVKTIMGRRRRFEEWENAAYGAQWSKPLPKAMAEMTWDRIKRAGTYRAWNSVVQGTSAELTKIGLVNYAKAGYLQYMTIHDEGCASVADMKQAKIMKECMESALELAVPMIAEGWIADNWAGTNKEEVV